MKNKANKEILREKTKALLEQPGVYIMYDEHGDKLYIGKSVNIKQRVRSYWSKSGERSRKIKRMIHLVKDFEVHYTPTELDALLLESEWIECFEPPYNTALTRQDKEVYFDFYKPHPYSIKVSRMKKTRADVRFGPFPNKRLAMKGYRYIFQNYPYFFCDYTNKKLNQAQCHSIMKHRCNGICESKQENLFEETVDFLFGINSNIEAEIQDKVNQLSEAWEFEKAGELYEQLKGIRYIRMMNQWIKEATAEDYIGKLYIAATNQYKYYLVIEGDIVATEISDETRQEISLYKLRETYTTWCEEKPKKINQSSVKSYQLIVIGHFKKNKMEIFEV